MRTACVLFCVLVCVGLMLAQQQQPRVFITDSQSWEMTGAAGGKRGAFAAGTGGGARPQTAEIIKTFGQKCKRVVVNNLQEKADYVILLDHEGGKGWLRKDNKVAVFDSNGDSILSRSTRSLGNSVDDACGAIKKDWKARGLKRAQARQQQLQASTPPITATVTPATGSTPEMTRGKVSISSLPAGAEIEVNGALMGHTPSALVLKPGEYRIVIKKNGFKIWERKLTVTSGEASLVAELEKEG